MSGITLHQIVGCGVFLWSIQAKPVIVNGAPSGRPIDERRLAAKETDEREWPFMHVPATKTPRLLAVPTETLFRQCEQWGVPVLYGPIEPLNGLYMSVPDHPTMGQIILASSLSQKNTPLFRSVLAVMMGYHAYPEDMLSGSPASLPKPDRCRMESYAKKWAAKVLVPPDAVDWAITMGASVDELAAVMVVTADLALLAVGRPIRGG